MTMNQSLLRKVKARSAQNLSYLRSKKKKENKKSSDVLLQKAIESLEQSTAESEESDDYCFGRYIGKYLSAMLDNMNKCILKNKIQNLISETQILNMQSQQNFQQQFLPSQFQPMSQNSPNPNFNQCYDTLNQTSTSLTIFPAIKLQQ